MNFKNFKLVQKLKDISPRLKWAMFSGLQDYKIGSRYIDYIIPEAKKINEDNEKLEKMVRDTLIKEFSPKIKNMKSFDKALFSRFISVISKKKSLSNYL